MAVFVPPAIATPYHFDIRRGDHGTWIARDRGGLAGGTFLTYQDALRFALFEAGGDSARVHFFTDGESDAARLDAGQPLSAGRAA